MTKVGRLDLRALRDATQPRGEPEAMLADAEVSEQVWGNNLVACRILNRLPIALRVQQQLQSPIHVCARASGSVL